MCGFCEKTSSRRCQRSMSRNKRGLLPCPVRSGIGEQGAHFGRPRSLADAHTTAAPRAASPLEIGFVWVRFSARPPFAAPKRRNLGSFCTIDDTPAARAGVKHVRRSKVRRGCGIRRARFAIPILILADTFYIYHTYHKWGVKEKPDNPKAARAASPPSPALPPTAYALRYVAISQGHTLLKDSRWRQGPRATSFHAERKPHPTSLSARRSSGI